MSIVDDRTEREQARAKLAETADERLLEDLGYWTVAAHDHHREFDEITERRRQAADLYNHATAWVGLIGEELHRRRTAGREPAS